MKRFTIFKRNYAQVLAEFLDIDPVAYSTIRLLFYPNWFTNSAFTPFQSNIGPLLHDSTSEIVSLLHNVKITKNCQLSKKEPKKMISGGWQLSTPSTAAQMPPLWHRLEYHPGSSGRVD